MRRHPLAAVLVRGPSMEPVLHDGDALLVRPGARVCAGDLVVGRRRGRPGLLVVKRAVRPDGPLDGSSDGSAWLLASDNTAAPGAVGGPGEVEAVVLARWWPLPPVLLRRPRVRLGRRRVRLGRRR